MDSEVLRKRLEELGWTPYRLAQEVAKIRRDQYGDTFKDHRSLIGGITAALENPEKASAKILECMILAMDGNLIVRWKTKKMVVEEREESL